jgi:uncharacterized membrane protein
MSTVDGDPVGPAGSAEQSVSAWRQAIVDVIVSRELLLALVTVGTILRVVEYAANRSLWLDEAALALNLEKPVSDLLRPLDFGQAAPLGFLIIERLTAELFGYSEYALRLFPLICGVGAVAAFAALARLLLTPRSAPLAVLFVAVSSGLVYYSSELKPYEVDAAATTLLLLAGAVLVERPVNSWVATAIGLGGAALAALSLASVFALAAVGVVLAGKVLKGGAPFRPLALAVGIWVLSAASVALFAVSRLTSIRDSFKTVGGGVVGPAVLTVHSLNGFATGLAVALGFPQSSPWNQSLKVVALAVVVGSGSLVMRKRGQALMVILPVCLTFAVAVLNQYPLTARTTLFLVPCVALALAEGVERLVAWAPKRSASAIAVVLVAVIAAWPTWEAARAVVKPRTHEEIKPVLKYVRDHWRRGDTLYVHYGAWYAFLYYEKCGCISLTGPRGGTLWPVGPQPGGLPLLSPAFRARSRAIVAGPVGASLSEQLADLSRLGGRTRVWFLYSHATNEAESIQPLLRRLNEMGRRTAGVDEPGAHAYLYTLESRSG